MHPADRPTGIVAAKYDVTIQIPAYHAPPQRTATIIHSNPGTPGSYCYKQYLAEAPCFPAKSRPPPPPRDSIDWCITLGKTTQTDILLARLGSSLRGIGLKQLILRLPSTIESLSHMRGSKYHICSHTFI